MGMKDISQRECYQRGYKAGFDKAIDEAVKALYEEGYDDEYGVLCFNNNSADKIKELKS